MRARVSHEFLVVLCRLFVLLCISICVRWMSSSFNLTLYVRVIKYWSTRSCLTEVTTSVATLITWVVRRHWTISEERDCTSLKFCQIWNVRELSLIFWRIADNLHNFRFFQANHDYPAIFTYYCDEVLVSRTGFREYFFSSLGINLKMSSSHIWKEQSGWTSTHNITYNDQIFERCQIDYVFRHVFGTCMS